MCGRFSQFSDVETLAGGLHAVAAFETRPPIYNLAPGMSAGVVVAAGAARRYALMRWGLVPSWAKDPGIGNRLINARVETVAQKPSFRQALQHRRCLVPADGFFEWSGAKGHRQPWFVHAPGGRPLAIAGLWELWQPAGGGAALQTFTLLTTAAVGGIAEIHDRMPVILSPAVHDRWLGRGILSPSDLSDLRDRCGDAALSRYRVSTAVNTAGNNTAACIAPLPEGAQAASATR